MTNTNQSNQEFNNLWTRVLNLPKDTDVYAMLSIEDLIILKECISNINGVITQQVATLFIEWLGAHGILTTDEVEDEKKVIAETSACANGYDVDIPKSKSHPHIVAEVKCNIPTSPAKFSVMQKKGIIKDLAYMSNPTFKKGKTEIDMNDTLRFMVVLDYKSDTKDVRAAMDDLLDFIQTHDSISIHHVVYKLSANANSDIAPINIYQDGDMVDNETIHLVYIPLT